MFGRGIKLFRLFGFEVRVDASWLIIAALLTWSLATGFFPSRYHGLAPSSYWWMGVVGTLGLFGSVVIHELFHSLVARRNNLPMKGITLFIFGGVAQMGGEPSSPGVEFWMAIAGPLASIGIGIICYAIYRVGQGAMPPEVIGVIGYLAWINWILAAFNLIPAFPLDGGRVLRSALWHFQGDLRRATRIASTCGNVFGILLMAYAVISLFTGNFIGAVWYFLIGMFLRNAASMSYQQLLIREALQGEPIRRFMTTEPITVPPEMSIEHLVDDYVYKYHHKMFPVVGGADHHLEGCVSTKEVSAIPREEWPSHTVEEVLKPCSTENTVSPDADALTVLTKMSEGKVSRVLVAEKNHLLAIVSIKDLMRFIASKLELEGSPVRIAGGHGFNFPPGASPDGRR